MTIEWLAGNRIRGTSAERTVGTSGISLTGTQTTSGTTATSLSVSINVGDYSNKALIVCVTQQSGSTTSVKVGSNSFTNVDIQNGGASGTGSQRTEIWYLLDSDITNNASNQIDWVGSAGSRVSIGVYSLNNVNQTVSGNFVSSSAYGTASTTTGAVNSVDSGGFIIDILSANSSTQPTDTLTEGWNIFISTNRYAVSQYNASPSTDNDMFYSNVTGAEWAWSGVAIKPVTAIPALMPSLQSPNVGGWVEVGRFTGGASGTITSLPIGSSGSNIPNKEYYMYLSTIDSNYDKQVIQFNGDTSSNYAWRQSTDGATDALSSVSGVGSIIGGYGGSGLNECLVGYISNKSNKEKLVINSSVSNAGGASKLHRRNSVGKWTNTTDPIQYMNFPPESGNFNASGAEVVVLGWDPTDTHTDNFWEPLADVSWSSGNTMSTGVFASKKYLMVQGWLTKADGGGGYISMHVGNNTIDTTGTYKLHYSFNGATDADYPNDTTSYTGEGLWSDQGNSNGTRIIFATYFIINVAGKQKIIMANNAYVNTNGSAAVAPERTEMIAKWNDTSNQINIIDFIGKSTADFTNGQIKVWGSD